MEHRFPQVASAVNATLADARAVPAFHHLLRQLMTAKGRILDSSEASRWPAFVLETCRALGGDCDQAVWAAAAVEFAAAAAIVVDDLVDDEWDVHAISPQRACNASAALIWLAQRSASRLVQRSGLGCAWRVTELLAQGYLDACAGEDLDLVLEEQQEVTEDLAHEMTRRKSGALVAMACQVGAAVAADDPQVLDIVGRFGCHLGLAAQMLNDLAGIVCDLPMRNSDIRRRKKTLPVVYALRCAREEGYTNLLAWYQGMPEHDTGAESCATAEHDIAVMIRELGGLHYGWVLAEAHRREALAALGALACVTKRVEVYALQRLVPTAQPVPA